MKKVFLGFIIIIFIGCANNFKESLKYPHFKPVKVVKNNNYLDNNKNKKYEKKVVKENNFSKLKEPIMSNSNLSQEEFNNSNKEQNITQVLYSLEKKKPLKKISKIYKVKNSSLLYINLGPIVHFDTDKYKIKKEYLPKLDKIINELKECNCSILVVGHTDSRGSDRYNQALSELRAREVYKYMIQRGINKNRLDYIGYGEEQPLTTNATPSGRAINRRVELLISKDLNVSFSFLKDREINSSYWNNHNIKTAGKIEISKKGWTKKLQSSQIKNILIKLKKKKRDNFIIKKDKRTLKIKLKRRILYIKGK